jgi:hypothetical protein
MIKYKIDVTKIVKDLLYKGEKGTYLNGVFFDNKNGPGEYGDDGYIVQDISKEARERGEKGPIIGNWRHLQTKSTPAHKPAPATSAAEDDDIPF